jgi:pimeloyl-ACP methyl ester carboxylesterase
MPAKPMVVLVHGAWSDGSSWTRVIPLLQAAGHRVIAVQLDLAGLAEDVAITRTVLAAHDSPIVLVGHAYGGAVISGAWIDTPQVISLVYVAAFAPDAGESLGDAVASFPAAPGNASLIPDDRPGYLRIDPAAYPQVYMQDVHPVEARTLAVTQKPLAATIFGTTAGKPAWRQVPSWYVVSEDDRMINPDAERAMAARMGAITTTVQGSSHASPVSHPVEVARVILAAALGGEHRRAMRNTTGDLAAHDTDTHG